MTIKKNRFAARAKITETTFRKLIQLYSRDMDASHIAAHTELNRKTVSAYLRRVRDILAEECMKETLARPPFAVGDVHFLIFPPGTAPRRPGGYLLSGLLRRDGAVSVDLGVDCEEPALKMITEGRMLMRGWHQKECAIGFTRMINLQFFDSSRVDAWLTGETIQLSAGDMVELFFGLARQRLLLFRGIGARHLRPHIKECEFRFNSRGRDLYREMLRIVREHPLH